MIHSYNYYYCHYRYQMDSDEDKDPVTNHIRTLSLEEDMSEEHPPQIANDHSSNGLNLRALVIPSNDDVLINKSTKIHTSESCSKDPCFETILDGYEAADDSFDSQQKCTSSTHDQLSDDEDEPCIDDINVVQRISSHKETNCFQLGRQLSSCKWSTGAGPRIGCLRDYPTELQSHALEQANLSPKSAPSSLRFNNNVLCTSPLSFENSSLLRRDKPPYRTQSTPLDIGSVRITKFFD